MLNETPQKRDTRLRNEIDMNFGNESRPPLIRYDGINSAGGVKRKSCDSNPGKRPASLKIDLKVWGSFFLVKKKARKRRSG